MCSGSCHSVTDRNLVKTFDLPQLTLAIAATMPFSNPALCVGQCAADTALYIALNNPNFGAGGSSSSSGGLGYVAEAKGSVDAAPVAIHRLNRAQYNNTVRDLFGTALTLADDFPEDDFGYGFNNIARVLSVSLTHLEQHFQAADTLVEEALNNAFGGQTEHYEAEEQAATNLDMRSTFALLNQNGSMLTVLMDVHSGGAHRILIRAGQDAGGPDDADMLLVVNGMPLALVSVAAPRDAMQIYQFELDLDRGPNTLEIEFTNDYWREGGADRNLAVDWIKLQNLGTGDRTLISCDAAEGTVCARQTLAQFASRAWRRPASVAEVDKLVALYEASATLSGDFRDAIGNALRAVILSPNFLYRPELDESLNGAEPKPLKPYELASRLSYFLWSSMPDQTLFDLAADGSLLSDNVLRTQVRRMLDSDKAQTLIENFAVQWLKFDRVLEANPDLSLYPGFGPELVESMRQESRLFLHEWFGSNAPVSQLLAADYSYIDSRLAAHYGVSGVSGDTFVRHHWAGDERRGMMGHASVLTATSHPANTSPVRRGVWVLENLLCKAPPPPPPGVESLADGGNAGGLTTRERFEMHRDTSTVCFSCHFMMDPIGFGLENYNAVGQWRNFEGDAPVDASGTLPGGLQFRGPLELSQVLAESPELPLCVTQHMLTYALGRGVAALSGQSTAHSELPDYPLVYNIYQRTQPGGHRIRDIIEEIVLSPAFRMRRGADSVGAAQ